MQNDLPSKNYKPENKKVKLSLNIIKLNFNSGHRLFQSNDHLDPEDKFA